MSFALLLIFCSVFAFVLALYSLGSRSVALSRLLRLPDGPVDIARTPRDAGRRAALGERVAAAVAQLGGDPTRRTGTYRSVRLRLVQAGFRRRSAVAVYLGSRVVTTLGSSLLVILFPLAWQLSDLAFLLALAGAAGLGFVLPGLFVDAVRRRRQGHVRRGLPDAIDLMVVCLEAGLALRSALLRVASEFELTNPVLASEFRLVVLETQAGKHHVEALRALGDRTGVAEISSFVAMLIQTERFGTDLAETFRVHSESLRAQRLLAAEEVAQKAPVKMLVPAALFIFPATLVVTIGPGILQILDAFK